MKTGFEPAQSETAFLRQRLLEEQADAQRAHQARIEAEARCHAAERERDVYRLLANRWQSRLRDLLRHRGGDASAAVGDQDNAVAAGQDDMEAALDSILEERRGSRAIVVSAMMLRRFQGEDDDDDEEEDEHSSEMEEDGDDMLEDVAASGSNESIDEASTDHTNARRTNREYSVTMEEAEDDDSDTAASPTTAMSLASRPQVRAVSISSDDF